MSTLIPILRLLRASNVLTATSNILMGYLLVHGAWFPWTQLFLLVASSCCFYMSGMVLNDVFDIEQDKRERPQRPLPSGQISVHFGSRLGFALLGCGLLLGIGSGWVCQWIGDCHFGWKSGVVSVCLATLILVYDAGGKASWFGPFLMGSCRSCNVLLGCSLGEPGPDSFLGFSGSAWLVAGAIGLFVSGLTMFARSEAIESRRLSLSSGVLISASGCLALLALPWVRENTFIETPPATLWIYWGFLFLVFSAIGRRALRAIAVPSPARVQQTVVVSLLSLIMIDAAVCYLAVPDQPAYGLIVAGFVVPTMILGRWISPT